MDFFGAQDQARQRTKLLLGLYLLAIAAIIFALYALFAVLMLNSADAGGGRFWDPRLFAGISIVTLAIIGGASLVKLASLGKGGPAVARSLGGQEVPLDTRDPAQRRLLNVVEEMAIAAGVPMPAVFLLDDPAINAFAAGFQLRDAAIGVTRGCMEKLSRDELQGVIAHEFSHILNGDMRLNIRLIGPLFGLLVIAFVGRLLLRASLMGGGRRSKNDRGGGMALAALGLGIVAIGTIGVFFGRLIQAAISRQREFLADAAAVQFTRNPDGIAGALKRIGFRATGSRVRHAHATDTAHMFFANALGGGLATHPPLPVRIRAIDPQWDGEFLEPYQPGKAATAKPAPKPAPAAAPAAALSPAAAVAMVGGLSMQAIHAARRLRKDLHAQFASALEDLGKARLLLLATILDDSADVREAQLALLAGQLSAGQCEAIADYASRLDGTDGESRHALLQVLLGVLRRAEPDERQQLVALLQQLAMVDQNLSIRELLILRLAGNQLGETASASGFALVDEVQTFVPAIAQLLGFIASLEAGDEAAARSAFANAVAATEDLAGQLEFPAQLPSANDLPRLFDSLTRMSFRLRKAVLAAAARLILADSAVSDAEWNSLSLIALALECPMPPLGGHEIPA